MANLLRAKEVAAKRGRSVGQLYKDIKEGRFPPGVPLSSKVVVWREADVDKIIDEEFKAAAAKEAQREAGLNTDQAA